MLAIKEPNWKFKARYNLIFLWLYFTDSILMQQSLEDEIVSETVLRLAGLQSWHSLSYGRFQVK